MTIKLINVYSEPFSDTIFPIFSLQVSENVRRITGLFIDIECITFIHTRPRFLVNRLDSIPSFGPKIYPRGSLVIALVRPSVVRL